MKTGRGESVDEYVFGYCLQPRLQRTDHPSADHEMTTYIEALVATGEYPQLAALAETVGLEAGRRQIESHLVTPRASGATWPGSSTASKPISPRAWVDPRAR